MSEFLPFSRPSISQAAIDEVIACLKSGWITTGPRVAQFTEALKEYFYAKERELSHLEAPFVLLLASATAGLHLALLALGLQPGDEIITTPLTFAATLNTIVLAGGKPVLVDIDPKTFNMNIELLEQAISPHTRAILPVHFAGLAVNLDALYEQYVGADSEESMTVKQQQLLQAANFIIRRTYHAPRSILSPTRSL